MAGAGVPSLKLEKHDRTMPSCSPQLCVQSLVSPTRQTLPWTALPHSPCTPPPLAVQEQHLAGSGSYLLVRRSIRLAVPGRQRRLGAATSPGLSSPPRQCDDVVRGLSPSQAILGELKPPQRQNLTAFLRLVGCSVQGGHPGPAGAVSDQKLFSTAYLLVSALAGTAPRVLLLL